MSVLAERIATIVHAFSDADRKDAVRELARDVASLEAAADALAEAAHATFGPTKGKTGNERDDLDSALSEYYLAVRKYNLNFNARPIDAD